ncbi:ACT domain-containing protein [Zongyangia hominis]|uniref:aspartate kinase n=1 Tax=Zongyangia hominis TaxID=2763677 RepID=A0A926IAU1_9FIRM|nr:ACT domain-containing protein [Zongyangia hominis]MBC8569568.1 ACT domain-containing protein [Zongyangia hominis]
MNGVQQISTVHDIALITFNKAPAKLDFISHIFTAFSEGGINIDMISQTPPQGEFVNLSFTVEGDSLASALAIIAKLREDYPSIKPMVSSGNCKISLFGEEMREQPGVAASAIAAVAKAQTEILVITTSEIDISFLFTEANYHDALVSLEETFGIKA